MSAPMPPGEADWRAALARFEQVRDGDAAARAAALDATPEGPEREALRRLLAADARPGPLDRALPVPTPDEEAPGVYGRWQTGVLLGRGGMSVVHRARSLVPPLGQEAALKRLALAVIDDAARARFTREMEILARLRHPGIAALLDAGVSPAGEPWFAMGLVEGAPIDAWADARRLGPAERVALLLQVCDAVAHAHRQLVVHRDLKPGNVLVDDTGRVTVLDFGIARVLEDGAAELTSGGAYAFTPRFAAPEQRAGGAIGTATDVWGLGALGLHLLTGRAPGEGQAAALAGLPRDLAAVLAHALEDAPEARYPGVPAFADDLRAWRDGRPVRARAIGPAGRAWRWARRHPGVAALSLSLLLSLAGGLAASQHQARRAEAARASAERQLAVIHDVLREVSPALDDGGRTRRGPLLEAAEASARARLADDPAGLASVLASLADVYAASGHQPKPMALMDEAVALDESSANASLAASFRSGRRAAMSAARREAAPWDAAVATLQAAQARHVAEAPATREEAFLTMSLARLQSRRGEGEAALATARAGLARCTALEEHCLWMRQVEGDVLWNMGRAEASLQAYSALQDALANGAYYEPGGRASADVAYARALADTGHVDEALALLEAFFERHRAVHDGPTRTSLQALRLLSQARQRRGDRAGALKAADDEVAQATALMGASSFDALGARIARARLLQAAGRLDEALAEVDAALPGFIEITGPASAHALQARGQRADLLMALGRADEALPVLREVVSGLTAGVGPQALPTLRQRVLLARALLASGDAPAARAEFDALVGAFGALGRDADARSVAAERDEIGVD